MKRVLIFGATGSTGRHLVDQSLDKGYIVKAFVRDPDKMKIAHPNIEIFKGDVLNIENVKEAMDDQEVILCSLGMPASDSSGLRTKGTANIIHAMNQKMIKRLICQTSLGYGDSENILPWHMKYLIVPLLLKNAFKDHQLQEEKIISSNVDWTIVRPGNLTNGKKTKNYKHGFSSSEKVKLKISRADVAHFMLQQIESDKYMHRKVALSY